MFKIRALRYGSSVLSVLIYLAMNQTTANYDEPCSALDPISTRQVEELCLQLKESYTIITVTHNMQQASRTGLSL